MISILEDAWSSLKDKRRGNRPIAIPFPIGLDTTTMMRSHEIGHGFEWLVLQEHPVLVAYGMTSTNVPQMLLVHRTVWIHKKDDNFLERIQHVFDRLRGSGRK
jgi:hypothetical protein